MNYPYLALPLSTAQNCGPGISLKMYQLPYQRDSVFVGIIGPLLSNKAPKQLNYSDLTVCQPMGQVWTG